MTSKLITQTTEVGQRLVVGMRIIADVQRRVRELEARQAGAMTAANRRELERLREFLSSLTADGGQNG